ncbi:MAG TPA: Spy/CpxP family protein refolding chaperone [Polyangiaceae bacterium]|nr:Spy/CpxP family protein refolding chaperone [Polyangiaceae bacterium]
MLGFVFGTVCLVALVKVLRHGHHGWHYAHGYGGGCGPSYGGWGGHHHGPGPGFGRGFGRWGRGGFGDGFLMRGLFSRLETTPGQEKVIRSAFEKVRETMREARSEWRDPSELSTLLRGDTFDRTAAEGLSGKADASFAKLRVVVVEALAQIHEALDDRQRRILADIVESRGGLFRHGRGFRGGPYRETSGWYDDSNRWV